MENIHDGSPQSSAHLSSVSSRLSISHISHPHSYPTHYQAVSTPSPESPHSVSPHSQISTPNYSAYRDDSHEVASYQNGSGILDPVSDHSSNYMNTQNNVVHGSYSHTLMSHHSSIPRYDSPPPVLAPIQDERVLRGDIRIPQMHHSITPPASLSYMHHSQVQSSYPYHAPHVGLGQGAWKADNALRARPSTGYV
jgi:zinc finger protein CreA/MIG